MTAQPVVTVVIPSHARPELLRRAVATASAQVLDVPFEIVVVDDGSPVPATEALAATGRGNATEIRIIRHPQPIGVARARNQGVVTARGEWVAFLDDDDIWAPDKLACQLAAMTEAGVHWSYTGSYLADDDLVVRWQAQPEARRITLAELVVENVVGTPSSVMVSTDLMRRTSGFDPTLSILADWDMWLQLAERDDGICVPAPLIGYITHEGSMHRQGLGPIVREFRRLRSKHQAGGRLGSAGLWRWMADTSRATGQRYIAIPIYLVLGIWTRSLSTLAAAPRSLIPVKRMRRSVQIPPTPPWMAQWQAGAEGALAVAAPPPK